MLWLLNIELNQLNESLCVILPSYFSFEVPDIKHPSVLDIIEFNTKSSAHDETNHHLFEGDIILRPPGLHQSVTSDSTRWWPVNDNGIVDIRYRFGDS